jgi:hypothetical protein
MDKITKLVGSINYEDFLRGLLQVSDDNTMGGVWEKCVTCNHCIFEKQCQVICSTMEDVYPSKNPTCRDVINLLLGDISIEDIK